MQYDDLNSGVLGRYLAGEGSDQDKEKVEAWLKADSAHKRELEELRNIWKSASGSDNSNYQKFDEVEQAWNELKKQMDRSRAKPLRRYSRLNSYGHTSRQPFLTPFLKVAAVLLIVGLIGFLVYSNFIDQSFNSSKNSASSTQSFATKKGQQMKLTLSDGTQVFLNADSKFKVPQDFNAQKREVYLTGEAYFKVVKNPAKPFVVHSRGTVTRDLGTSFDIRAYPGNKNVTVVVKEGKVNFKAENSRQKDIISAKHMAGYNIEDHQITRKTIDDLGLYLGWTRNEINFKDASMRNVAKRLERRYNIKVTFKDKSIKKMKLTASLKNSMIQHVLNLITKALNIQYKMENNKVIFSDK